MTDKEKFSILLVDDDPAVVRILRIILAEFTPLRFATSGRDALKLAREAVPDLMLLDIEMPGLNGFEVCKSFKADPALAQIPIIFVTSHESVELEATGLKLGAVDFITKPPHAALVLARVRAQRRVHQLTDTLRNVVTMDFLTGTANRLKLEKTIRDEWRRAQRSAAPLALLLAEVDGFKSFSAEHSEEDADNVLRAIAEGLRTIVNRPADLLARYAAETFAILLPETETSGAATIARRAIQAVDAAHVPHSASPTSDRYFTLSVGASWRSVNTESAGATAARTSAQSRASAEDLIAAAEQALAAARSDGGHQARFVDVTKVGRPDAVVTAA